VWRAASEAQQEERNGGDSEGKRGTPRLVAYLGRVFGIPESGALPGEKSVSSPAFLSPCSAH
jgi:hypothetical protein